MRLTLPPTPDPTWVYDKIEAAIVRVFRKEVYLPLLRHFFKKTLTNASDSLEEAIRAGRVTFNRGVFSGKWNATVAKELRELGARFNRGDATYRITRKELPLELQNLISASEFHYRQKMKKIDRELADVVPMQLANKVDTTKLFEDALWETEKGVKRSLKGLTVPAQLTPEQRLRIATEYRNNMDLWISDFTKKEIKELRDRMQKSVFAGNRFESAIKSIQDSYGVTQRKAKFLASQETRLLTTKYKEVRYEAAGVRSYKWRSVTGTPAHPVRPMHKALNERSEKGELFRFDKPPVDSPDGSRHNPGENFGCRCVAIPVIDFRE